MLCLLSNCKLPFCSFFVPLLSHVWNFATPWTTAPQASLCFTISLSLLKLMSIESAMPPNHLILCYSLLLLPSVFPSIRVFSSESALCIKWPKYWSISFGISPSNEYSGLISFRIDWFDLLERVSKGLSRVFSSTTVQNHQFFGALPSVKKEMATHSRILAWRIPRTEEPGRLESMGSQKSDTT